MRSILLVLLLLTTPALAQGPANLESLHIALWPEFDDPRLLVIIDGVLSQPGAAVRVPIPAGVELNAVATADANGGFLNAAYKIENDANGQVVVFTPATAGFRIEYYAPLSTSDDQRQAAFTLPAGYLAPQSASLEVLAPPDAANIVTDPAMQPGGTGTGGGQLFQRTIAGVVAASVSQTIRYDNPAGALTVSETARATTAPAVAPATPQRPASSSRTPLLIGLGLLAILLIAAGSYGVWRTRQPAPELPSAPKTISRAARPRPSGSALPAAPGQDRFCRQCGAEFQNNDRFCRQCGAARQ